MRKTEILAYTAGIIDGEGHIRFSNNKRGNPAVEVRVTNTKEWLCQWLRMQYGGWVTRASPSNKNKRWNMAYRWGLPQGKAEDFLRSILPYLNLKRPHAEIVLSFLKQKRGNKQHILTEADKVLMSSLNKRGT